MSAVPCSEHVVLRAWSLIASRITHWAILAREDTEAYSILFLAPDQSLQAVWLGPNSNFRSLTACWGWVGPDTEEEVVRPQLGGCRRPKAPVPLLRVDVYLHAKTSSS